MTLKLEMILKLTNRVEYSSELLSQRIIRPYIVRPSTVYICNIFSITVW